MADALGGNASEQLKSIVDRIERLESEKQAIADDIKEIYAEAKGNGYDCPTIRKVIRQRKKDKAKLQEEMAFEEMYYSVFGLI